VGQVITVVGCGGGPFPAPATARLAAATLLVGGARQLSTVDGLAQHAERVVLGDLTGALDRLREHHGDAVVLASGDPGFFGVVRALRRAGLRPEVLPAPSSVAVAFARLGLPWDDAVVVSAHGGAGGRDLRRAVNACRAHPTVAVLTGPGAGPAELAAGLPGRRLVVASRLGAPDERIGDYDGRTWPEPTVVLALSDEDTEARWLAGAPPGPAGWALPETAFAHRDSMVTKAEVRALVLARLGPRLGDLVWDVGAGSGSVAVECARLGAAVIAVDRDPAAADLVRHNADTFGVPVEVVTGVAPAAMAGLPDPDAVFVGGGGPDVLMACAGRRPDRIVAAYAAIERIGPALDVLRGAGYRVDGSQLHANRLVALPDGAHRLAATNPVTVLWGVPT
jgi:precorrin-6B C5,15-methyltransferase / cobalt-precorrin-6B C5,C15-methyltransferase